jgi:hypothetical protein
MLVEPRPAERAARQQDLLAPNLAIGLRRAFRKQYAALKATLEA